MITHDNIFRSLGLQNSLRKQGLKPHNPSPYHLRTLALQNSLRKQGLKLSTSYCGSSLPYRFVARESTKTRIETVLILSLFLSLRSRLVARESTKTRIETPSSSFFLLPCVLVARESTKTRIETL